MLLSRVREEGVTPNKAPQVDFVSPDRDQASSLDRVLRFMESHGEPESTQGSSYLLGGADGHDSVELNAQVYSLLKQVVQLLSRGQSVGIVTHDEEISTQRAAELLGLSRPTVVKLINGGDLAATVPGQARRRLRLADVLEYRASLYERRSDFLSEISEAYSDEDIDGLDVAGLVDEARHATR